MRWLWWLLARSYHVTSRCSDPSLIGRQLLGGTWRQSGLLLSSEKHATGALAAGVSRPIATYVSFAHCSIYLPLLPVNAEGIALRLKGIKGLICRFKAILDLQGLGTLHLH